MIPIKQVLRALVNYYCANRARGHTRAMAEGAANVRPQPIVLVHSMDYRPVKGADHISIFNTAALIGRTDALVVDNHCLALICDEAMSLIINLERRLEAQREAAQLAQARMTDDMKALEHLLDATREKLKRAKAKRTKLS